MIYTLTLNPSVDYHLQLEKLRIGELNRSVYEEKQPGGKGINVSRVLNEMGVNSIALGYVGGLTGEYIKDCLAREQIETSFIHVNEDTRINIKISAEEETEVNQSGPIISDTNYADLLRIMNTLTNEDMVIISGNPPTGIDYIDIFQICMKNAIPFVLDAEAEHINIALAYRPFFLKPNHKELGALFNTSFSALNEMIPYCLKLVKMGAQHVMVSMGDKGAVLATKEKVYQAEAPTGKVLSTIGAGDSMVAGFLAKYIMGEDIERAFAGSVAAGSATAFTNGICRREQADCLVERVIVTKEEVEGC
ncbi:1-phosphofructokinase [Cytobacillus purgationiresistens]|uniref:Tagatose-6-phosphate kinase n=1 Tax=Cytobacillus purgationiresistens TaxID=863449 RepID=A0ABU0AGI0_9BACI|nr:1-phosphofructokinase [Cytobacillus purgationiresistens]MDQ0270372.1 1-phosphofructokinase [Cytobacillus purgationiresistens]